MNFLDNNYNNMIVVADKHHAKVYLERNASIEMKEELVLKEDNPSFTKREDFFQEISYDLKELTSQNAAMDLVIVAPQMIRDGIIRYLPAFLRDRVKTAQAAA